MSIREIARRILAWILVFLVWSAWESSLRIVLQHEAWNIPTSFRFLGYNLLPAVFLAVLLGLLHTLFAWLILKGKAAASAIVSPVGTALAFSISIALLLDPSQSWNALPGFMQMRFGSGEHRWLLYAAAALSVVAILALCLLVLRWTGRILLSSSSAVAALVLPVIALVAIQGYRNSRWAVRAASQGPVKKIVLISIDTLRADYVGAYGNANVRTPVLDRIAWEGARFEHAISSIPQTGPSHASMMTGMSPLSHGLHHNGYPLASRHHTLAEQLRSAGFRTAAFISGIPMKADFSGLDQGFQEYHDQLAPVDYISHTYYGRSIASFFRRGLLRRGQATTDPALKWLSANSDSSFFVFLHYFDPHYPYGRKDADIHGDPFIVRTGPEEVERQRQLYTEEVAYADQQVGRIVSFLQESGVYDQVLLIVVSDHGESLGEHNYYYDHDRYVYEQLVRVPFLVRCPGVVPPQTVIRPQVAVLDVYQTVLAAAGLKPANKTEGQNLLSLLASIPAEYEQRSILSHSFYFGVHGLRTNDWKLIARKRRFELFDLIQDPQELHNLYRHKRAVADDLKERLAIALRGLSTSEDATKDLTPEQLEDLRSLGYFQ